MWRILPYHITDSACIIPSDYTRYPPGHPQCAMLHT